MRVIGLAGWSGAGKTTLLVKLIPELNRRGLLVSTVKHACTPVFVTRPKPEASAAPLRPGARVAVGLTAFRVLPNYALASERASRVVEVEK